MTKNFTILPELRALIPPLTADEKRQLEENLLAEGIRDALMVGVFPDEETGEEIRALIDGHNRYDFATATGANYQTIEKQFERKDDAIDWMYKNQLGRRNVDDDTRAYLLGKIYEARKKAHGGDRKSTGNNCPLIDTSETIAQEQGVSARTVKNAATYSKAVDAVASATGRDAYDIIATFETRKDVEQLYRIQQNDPEAAKEIARAAIQMASEKGSANGRKITGQNKVSVRNAVRDHARQQEAIAAERVELPADIADLRHGDFVEVLADIPDGSLSAIITDPPYPAEYLDQWSRLSEFAAQKLKPGGFCIAYSGQFHLPEVMQRMSKHLDFYWQFILLHNGFAEFITPRGLYCNHKPILVFQNGFSLYKPQKQQPADVIDGSGRTKMNHVWEQGETELDGLIDYFTSPGDTICDPFAGSGTTLVKAAKMKRRPIGAEIDEQHFLTAKNRIANVTV